MKAKYKAVALKDIDEHLEDYKDCGLEDETFSSFIEGTTDDGKPVWVWVDEE